MYITQYKEKGTIVVVEQHCQSITVQMLRRSMQLHFRPRHAPSTRFRVSLLARARSRLANTRLRASGASKLGAEQYRNDEE